MIKRKMDIRQVKGRGRTTVLHVAETQDPKDMFFPVPEIAGNGDQRQLYSCLWQEKMDRMRCRYVLITLCGQGLSFEAVCYRQDSTHPGSVVESFSAGLGGYLAVRSIIYRTSACTRLFCELALMYMVINIHPVLLILPYWPAISPDSRPWNLINGLRDNRAFAGRTSTFGAAAGWVLLVPLPHHMHDPLESYDEKYHYLPPGLRSRNIFCRKWN